MNENEQQTFTPQEGEDYKDFMHRVINSQPDPEPLRIVEQLVEIAIAELKGRPYDISAEISTQRMKVTLRHNGRPIDGRMVHVMFDFTDRVDYYPTDGSDGSIGGWELVIRRDIPPLFVTRR